MFAIRKVASMYLHFYLPTLLVVVVKEEAFASHWDTIQAIRKRISAPNVITFGGRLKTVTNKQTYFHIYNISNY